MMLERVAVLEPSVWSDKPIICLCPPPLRIHFDKCINSQNLSVTYRISMEYKCWSKKCTDAFRSRCMRNILQTLLEGLNTLKIYSRKTICNVSSYFHKCFVCLTFPCSSIHWHNYTCLFFNFSFPSPDINYEQPCASCH